MWDDLGFYLIQRESHILATFLDFPERRAIVVTIRILVQTDAEPKSKQ